MWVIKKANALIPSSKVFSFFLPITPIPLSFPPHCLWKWLHGFGVDPCRPSAPLFNFPTANIQSLTWKDGKYFAKGRRREKWRVCSKRETSAWWGTLFEMVQSKTWDWDIVRKWPAVKLGPGPECCKWLLWQETGVLSQKRVLSWLPFPFSVLLNVLGYSFFLQWQTVHGCSLLIPVGTEKLHKGKVQLLSCLGAFTDSQSCLSINEVFPLQFISLDSSSPDCK